MSHWPEFAHVPFSIATLHSNVAAMIIVDSLGSALELGMGSPS